MKLYRVASSRHPIFSAQGALIHGGRWNLPGRGVIYAADSLATCLLEILVHTRGIKPPGTHAWVEIDVPESVSTEEVTPASLPGWDEVSGAVSQAFGDQWLREGRSCVLWVPSVAASGLARNAVINLAHPDFAQISATASQPLELDPRLFP